jgi:hypothetical protein
MLAPAVVLGSLTLEPWEVVVHRHIHYGVVQCCVPCQVAVGRAGGGEVGHLFQLCSRTSAASA